MHFDLINFVPKYDAFQLDRPPDLWSTNLNGTGVSCSMNGAPFLFHKHIYSAEKKLSFQQNLLISFCMYLIMFPYTSGVVNAQKIHTTWNKPFKYSQKVIARAQAHQVHLNGKPDCFSICLAKCTLQLKRLVFNFLLPKVVSSHFTWSSVSCTSSRQSPV